MKMIKYSKIIFLLLLISMNVGCDQITKKEVREHIVPHEVIEIIDKNLILTKVENTGAALSLGTNLSPILKLVFLQALPIVFMLGLLVYLLASSKLSKLHQIALAFIIGGGIGNLFDRVKYDSVTDFMFIEIGPFKTGIFNMVDVSISIGAIIILVTAFSEKIRGHSAQS